MKSKTLRGTFLAIAAIVMSWMTAGIAAAHCDALDGPVVKAAQEAIDKGDVKIVLPWVQKNGEPEIQAAFKHTMEVRKLGPEAKKLADNYFFETIVRVHRAGEGAPYTGLKPAGQDLGPALTAADKALETKDANAMITLVDSAVKNGIEKRFKEVISLSDYKPDDVEAGRKYVAAYVEYIHYVEGIYNATEAQTEHHAEAPATEEQCATKGH